MRLSAQCTDERVNKITPALFARFPTLDAFADADVSEVEEYVRSCGFYETARAVLESNKTRFGTDKITVNNDCAKVSIVGAGMQSHPGTASTMFEALYSQNINIHMISTSEIKISVIIDKADADRAVAAIHDAFIQ